MTHAPSVMPVPKAAKVIASHSHADERTAALLTILGKHELISMGSSLKLCLVAEGVAHFFLA